MSLPGTVRKPRPSPGEPIAPSWAQDIDPESQVIDFDYKEPSRSHSHSKKDKEEISEDMKYTNENIPKKLKEGFLNKSNR